MFVVIGLPAITIVIIALVYELRIRKPDQVVLYEQMEKIKFRSGKAYFRHFNLAISKTTHSFQTIIEASAKGNIDIKVKLSVSVSASLKNIPQLIKAGGWNQNATSKAAKELEIKIHSIIKEYAEKYEIEDLSSEKISEHLNKKAEIYTEKFGLEIISLTVQSFEASDLQISEAMRQRESARILEQTELLNQKTRISAAKAKLHADEEIAFMEHELQLKMYDLKNSELEKENTLASRRIEEEVKRGKIKLELDKEELMLLKNNPELLMLTPQAARLAEASQTLKNARTIVSFSPAELAQGADLLGVFQSALQNTASKLSGKQDNE